jgi:hypothetical protein
MPCEKFLLPLHALNKESDSLVIIPPLPVNHIHHHILHIILLGMDAQFHNELYSIAFSG